MDLILPGCELFVKIKDIVWKEDAAEGGILFDFHGDTKNGY